MTLKYIIILLILPSLRALSPDNPVFRDKKLFLSVSQRGLGKAVEFKKVLIVGAGIAGLVAAYELKSSGHEVVILEANSKVGGRIMTYRDTNGWYIELGAMRFPAVHLLTKNYIDRFNLSTNPFIQSNNNTLYYLNGIRARTWEVEQNSDIFNFNVAPTEKGKSAHQLFTEAVQPVMKEIADFGWNYIIKKYDSWNVEEYLNHAGLSPGAISYIGLVLNAESLFYTSFIEFLRDQSEIADTVEYYEITGGNDRLPQAFLHFLANDISYDMYVDTVKHNSLGVTVSGKMSNGSRFEESGDYLILTPTARMISTMTFIPPMPEDKQTAFRSVHYDSASKIVLYCNEKFWEQEGIYGGKSITDLPNRFIYYLNHSFANVSGGVLLASYTWSDDALRWTGLSDTECVNLAKIDVSGVHGYNIDQFVVQGVVKHWAKDPYALGAFPLFTPFQEVEFYDLLSTPLGRISFAGDHTTDQHAWVNGAIQSGIREAVRINANKVDVVIVGGGPIGLVTAYYAMKANLTVAVIEQYEFGNFMGSSAGYSRQFREMYEEKYLAEYAVAAAQLWISLEDELGLARGSILDQSGYLFFGDLSTGPTVEGSFDSIKTNCKELDLGCIFMNSEDIMSSYPFKGLNNKDEGIYHSDSGQINVQAMITALLKALNASKLITLKSNEQLVAINMTDPNSVVIKTDRGVLESRKLILAPGPFANDIFQLLNFKINMNIWEMASIYFKVIDHAIKFPTWFYFGGSESSLYYGFPENTFDNPGYVKISPDFTFSTFESPKNRTNKVNPRLIDNTKSFVHKVILGVDVNDYFVSNSTCLASLLPDNGFILSFAPSFLSNYKNVVIFTSGWGMKFVPLFGQTLLHLVVNGTSNIDISKMSIERPGILVTPDPSSEAGKLNWWVWLLIALVIVLIIILSLYWVYKRRTDYEEI